MTLVAGRGGGDGDHGGRGAERRAAAHGRPVHVDPIKPKLKLPGTQLLKLKCDEPLSKFAFKIELRRYTMEENEADMADEADEGQAAELEAMLNHLKI
jgi:hypothetical protein